MNLTQFQLLQQLPLLDVNNFFRRRLIFPRKHDEFHDTNSVTLIEKYETNNANQCVIGTFPLMEQLYGDSGRADSANCLHCR